MLSVRLVPGNLDTDLSNGLQIPEGLYRIDAFVPSLRSWPLRDHRLPWVMHRRYQKYSDCQCLI